MKICCKCKESKPFDAFSKNKTKKDGYNSYCRLCTASYQRDNKTVIAERRSAYYQANKEHHAAYSRDYRAKNREHLCAVTREYKRSNKHIINAINSARRFAKKQATPSWSETELIKTVYLKAQEMGMDVDHIVPLKSDLVCGLHVWHNLQILAKDVNISKNNRYWPDMPEEVYDIHRTAA